jgi:hypothetical protein
MMVVVSGRGVDNNCCGLVVVVALVVNGFVVLVAVVDAF